MQYIRIRVFLICYTSFLQVSYKYFCTTTIFENTIFKSVQIEKTVWLYVFYLLLHNLKFMLFTKLSPFLSFSFIA
jgi:hypothetical protein